MASTKDASSKRSEKREHAAPAVAEGAEPPAKVAEPDKAEMERKVNALQSQMNANKAEKTKLQKRLDAGTSAPTASGTGGKAAAGRGFRAELDAKRAAVQALIAEQTALRGARDKVLTRLKEVRVTDRASDLDARIARIDDRLSSEGHTLSLKEEKDLIKSRSDIVKQKRAITVTERERDGLEAEKARVDAELARVSPLLTAAKEEQRAISERFKAMGDVFGRLKELSAQNNELYGQIKAIQDEFWAQSRQYRAWRDFERKRKQEEYAAREAERVRLEAEAEEQRVKDEEESKPDHPWAVELVELDMLEHFLHRAAPEVFAEASGASAEASEAKVAAAGGVDTISKEQSMLEGLRFGDESSGSKKRGRGRGRGRGAAGSKASGPHELSFDLATLAMFSKFGITAPLSSADAAGAAKEVAAKRAEYESKPAPTAE